VGQLLAAILKIDAPAAGDSILAALGAAVQRQGPVPPLVVSRKEQAARHGIVATVDATGMVSIAPDDHEEPMVKIPIDELATWLQQRMVENNRVVPVRIGSTGEVPVRQLVSVLDAFRDAGYRRLSYGAAQ
jgi:biopolymer transport protein ExbD